MLFYKPQRYKDLGYLILQNKGDCFYLGPEGLLLRDSNIGDKIKVFCLAVYKQTEGQSNLVWDRVWLNKYEPVLVFSIKCIKDIFVVGKV